MALQRRTGQRFQAAIWPGFVDAMTGLLLVLMFLLTIFMVVQFVLRETISGQENELDALTSEVGALASALGMEEQRAGDLEARLGALNAALNTAQSNLSAAQDELASQSERIASLTAARERAEGRVADLEQTRTELLGEQEVLNTALAQSREKLDVQTEASRLAAAKREALEALVADLRRESADVQQRAAALQEQLSDEETARLAEAAAAQALRDKLENADAELTAMTLSLERQRQEAEDTLDLLAAAEVARAKLEKDLTVALADRDEVAEKADQGAARLASARAVLAEQKQISTEAQRQTALLNQQVSALRSQLGQLQALLDDYKVRDEAAQVQLQNLGTDLNAALARAASEERKRRLLEESESKRLAQEAEDLRAQAKDLERYRSEFFGRLRDLLGNQEGVRIEGDRFVFSSEVLFPLGSAQLSPSGKQQIARVADILRGIIDDIPPELDWVIRVDGHTDSIPLSGYGKYSDNWELSQGRALSVVRYMVSNLGIPPDRLTANGFGEFQPVNTANTPEARAQNRRIELKLTEK